MYETDKRKRRLGISLNKSFVSLSQPMVGFYDMVVSLP